MTLYLTNEEWDARTTKRDKIINIINRGMGDSALSGAVADDVLAIAAGYENHNQWLMEQMVGLAEVHMKGHERLI